MWLWEMKLMRSEPDEKCDFEKWNLWEVNPMRNVTMRNEPNEKCKCDNAQESPSLELRFSGWFATMLVFSLIRLKSF